MARRKGRSRSSIRRVRVATGVNGERAPSEPSGDDDPERQDQPPPPPSTGARRFDRRAVAIWVLAAALVAVNAIPAPTGHSVTGLYDIGRVLAAIGLVMSIAPRLLPFASLRAVRPWALMLMVLGLGALLGRHPWGFRVFSEVQVAELGFVSELAWLVLVLGLRRQTRTPDRLAHGLIALGAGWALIALCLPEPSVGTTATALGDSMSHPIRGLLGLMLLATLALGIAQLAASFMRRELGVTRRVVPYLPYALLFVLMLSGLGSDAPLHAVLMALLLVAIGINAEELIADRDAARDPPRSDRALVITCLVAICALWMLLKSHALIASNTDENIYFYMAKLVGDGKLPYRDYFFAHPPLHVMLPGLVFAAFGFSLTVAKLFPLIATLIAGLAVWGIARHALSTLAAPLALVLFLFATEVLKASSNMTGVNMTTMWLMLGVWQTLKGHPLRAGAFLGLAVTTGFYAAAPALAACLVAFFWRDPTDPERQRVGLRNGLAQVAMFALVAGAINLAFWSLGGETYLEGVYAYHGEKSFEHPEMVEIFGGSPAFPLSVFHNVGVMVGGEDFAKELFYHAHLWLAALALPLVVLASWLAAATDPIRRGVHRVLYPTNLFRAGPDGRALAIWLITLALFLELAMFRELYSFYFMLIYPFLALCAAYVIQRGLRLLAPPIDDADGERSTGATPLRPLLGAGVALTALVVVGLHGTLSYATQNVYGGEQDRLGARNSYTWTEPPALASLAGITKLIFWDDHRLRGGFEPGYRHYLWSKKRGFTVLDQVAAYIEDRSAPEETIAGASTLAPLVALLSDRRIAADEADTNSKRFATGLLAQQDYWNAICADRVRFIVAAPRSYFNAGKMRSLPIMKRAFEHAIRFEDPTLRYGSTFPIDLYRRIDGAECRWP